MTEQHPARSDRPRALRPLPIVSARLAALLSLLAAMAMSVPAASAANGVGDKDRAATSPWHISGEVELEYESENNFDLDSSKNEDEATLEPELDLEFAYRPTPLLQGFVRLELTREYGVGGEAETEPTRLKLAEAYVSSEGINVPGGGEVSLYVGRRLFVDEREWLYDEQLDGATLRYDYNDWSFSLSAARQQEKDLLSDKRVDETDYYIAYGRYRFEDRVLGAYLLQRREPDGDGAEPLFIGIQSSGELGRSAEYWLELAHMRGDGGNDPIRGWGVDGGVIYHLDAPLSPSLILGYAYGSGDGDAGDGVNGAFRQTGIQDNEQDLGGLVSFHYLGAALDPELSNLGVLTAGVGFRPNERISTHLLLHRYRQDDASPTLRDTNLDAEPNGTDRELGYGIDWVVGSEVSEAIELEAVVGYFRPGEAFGDDSDSAWFFGTKIEYEF